MPFKDHKIHIVSILAPESWSKTNILCSINIGMRSVAQDDNLAYDSMDVHATHLVDYKLEDPK